MAFFDDFKKFAFRGNVVDLAVGVVIGGAFGRVVSAVVDDIVMPFVSLLMPSGNWRAAGLVLRRGATESENTVLRFGDLFGNLLDFLIIALVLFIILKRIVQAAERALHLNNPTPGPSTTRPCNSCCETIPRLATRCRACCADVAADPA